MKNIVVIGFVGSGCHEIMSVLTSRLQDNNQAVVIVSTTEQLRSPFEPEPITIRNYKDVLKDTEYFEPLPSKFISKPKNNFKK